ncbi:uncharacterized protein LOC122073569 [Macadamia integrifolia]|uniref:uncharacterized protein LOC122073569 n=1 Tax=Macadamia integrifolia TaxID=60698 RepID=UPI001C4EF4B6|nr:uncharacterized protein LOC122073569 [Macadamia integrifolia]
MDLGERSSEVAVGGGSDPPVDRPPDRGKQRRITDFWKPDLRPQRPHSPVSASRIDPMESLVANSVVRETALPVEEATLADNNGRNEKNKNEGKKQSYATVARRTLPDVEDLPEPIHAGSHTKVIIPQEAYEKKLQSFTYALIGRVNFRFLSMDDVRGEPKKAWNLRGKVNLAPLGKGYILFRFELEGDMASIWKREQIKVKGRVIRFQRWLPEFNKHEDHIQTKLVWIRYLELPMEYWHEIFMLSMAKASGRPVAIDKRTLAGSMGKFARVFVEVELGGDRVEEIQVERRQSEKETLFWLTQRITYEDDIGRCNFCKKLGHSAMECRVKKADVRREEAMREEGRLADYHGRLEETVVEKLGNPSNAGSPRLEGNPVPPSFVETSSNRTNQNGRADLVDCLNRTPTYVDQGNLEVVLPITNVQNRDTQNQFMVDNPRRESGYGSNPVNSEYGSDGSQESSEEETQLGDEGDALGT